MRPSAANVFKRVLEFGTELLRENSDVSNKVVVFDFDDTIVDTRVYTPSYVPGIGMVEFFHKIFEMVELLKRAKTMGYAIFIITARIPDSEHIVWQNIKERLPEIIPYVDNIFASPITMTEDLEAFKRFKAVLRRNLEFIDLNTARKTNSKQLYNMELIKPFKNTLNIVLTIGDQPYDISNMSHYGILLPRPERDPEHAFLFSPNYPFHDICLRKI